MKSLAKRLLSKMGMPAFGTSDSPYEYLLTAPRYKEVTVKLLGHDFRVADPVSFYWSYREIFLQEIYRFESSKSSPLIIDCGANYGTSIVYFNKIFPSARIVAVEADPDIFKFLQSNIVMGELKNVKSLNRAVSVGTKPVKFYSEGADSGRLHYLEGGRKTFEIEPVKLDDLIEDEVDFLKIDIEGAETQVLCSCEKLGHVSQLFVEYHSFKNSRQTLADLLYKLSQHDFRYYVHTEFCSPRPLTQEKLYLGMDLQLNIFARRNIRQNAAPRSEVIHG
jgi:FkbM family methyltransferase